MKVYNWDNLQARIVRLLPVEEDENGFTMTEIADKLNVPIQVARRAVMLTRHKLGEGSDYTVTYRLDERNGKHRVYFIARKVDQYQRQGVTELRKMITSNRTQQACLTSLLSGLDGRSAVARQIKHVMRQQELSLAGLESALEELLAL